MAMAKVNNEIILLRHVVRQARVCIVNKLIREAKLLRNKHGNKIQQAKYKRKADRLIAEIHALKTVKDDDISKFGIMNERGINEVLQNQSSSDKDRIIAKVIHYKPLHTKLMQFKEKFPDYRKYLERGRKNTAKLKKKNAVKNKESLKDNHDKDLNKQEVKPDANTECPQYNSNNEELCKIELSETKSKSRKRKESLNEDDMILDKKSRIKLKEDNTLEDKDEQPNMTKLCNVTKEATVKRFTELLQEQEDTEDAELAPDNVPTSTVRAKSVDVFFITGDDEIDNQENCINSSTLYAKSNIVHDTPIKAFRSNRQLKIRNRKYKYDEVFGKTKKYNQLRDKSKKDDTNQDKQHFGQQHFATKEKERMLNRSNNKSTNNNKSINKNNLNNVAKEEEASLHPSWLAKKKQQEIMKQGFQGKKIVFADD